MFNSIIDTLYLVLQEEVFQFLEQISIIRPRFIVKGLYFVQTDALNWKCKVFLTREMNQKTLQLKTRNSSEKVLLF